MGLFYRDVGCGDSMSHSWRAICVQLTNHHVGFWSLVSNLTTSLHSHLSLPVHLTLLATLVPDSNLWPGVVSIGPLHFPPPPFISSSPPPATSHIPVHPCHRPSPTVVFVLDPFSFLSNFY